jgi:hypothetical protein
MTTLSAQHRWDIQQTLSYYGHLVDNSEWGRISDVVSDDLRLETPDGVFYGPSGVREFEDTPAAPAHHTVNTIIHPGATEASAVAWSRFILITGEGSAVGGDYLDTLELEGGLWKITARRVSERNRVRPGGEYSAAGAHNFASFEAAL